MAIPLVSARSSPVMIALKDILLTIVPRRWTVGEIQLPAAALAQGAKLGLTDSVTPKDQIFRLGTLRICALPALTV